MNVNLETMLGAKYSKGGSYEYRKRKLENNGSRGLLLESTDACELSI